MNKSIIELIGKEQSVQAVSFVTKTLANKLLQAISEQKNTVAKETYGSLAECFGADETPEFMDAGGDNAYQVFFQNALKKFGVNGPQDFQDENTKNQFFNYVDQNWKAQDALQTPQQVNGMGGVDKGTQTQLPSPATQPMPPTTPMPQVAAPVARQGGSEPSLATMAPAGPSINQTAPLGQDGDDQDLDAMQRQSTFDPDGDGDDDSDEMGDTDQDFAGDEDMGGNDDEQDPDLEIGDDDIADEDGVQPDFAKEPEDEQGLTGNRNSDDQGDDDSDLDSDFDDEDAFTADHNDFLPKDKKSNDSDEDSDSDDSDDDGSDDSDDSDDDGDGDNNFGRNGQDDSDDDDSDQDDDDEDDPDLDIGDDGDDSDDDDDDDQDNDSDDDSDDEKPKKKAFGESLKPSDRSRKTRKPAFNKATRTAGKQEVKKAMKEGEDGEIESDSTIGEDFGFGADNAEDERFLAERLNFFKSFKNKLKKDNSVDPEMRKSKLAAVNGGMKKHRFVQGSLDKIKASRNTILKTFQKQRAVIKSDPSKSTKQKKVALKQLAVMAKQTRQHTKQQALQLKTVHMAESLALEASLGLSKLPVPRSANPKPGPKPKTQVGPKIPKAPKAPVKKPFKGGL
jgi:hypothetical protein